MDSARESSNFEEHVHAPRDRGFAPLMLLAVLLMTSVSLNVLLAHKMSALSHGKINSDGLKIGTRLPSLVGQDPKGTLQVVDYSKVKTPTILYVFTPQCGFCKKNIDNLRALIANDGPTYRLVGVSLTSEDLQPYLASQKLSFPVLTEVSPQLRKIYRFDATPTTILISSEGKVQKVWTGTYIDSIRTDIDRELGISLPGCCNP